MSAYPTLGHPARTVALRLPAALLAAPLALNLAGCTELNRFIARPEPKPACRCAGGRCASPTRRPRGTRADPGTPRETSPRQTLRVERQRT